MKKIVTLILLCMCVAVMHANMYTSLYSDHKSFSIGDILTVHIQESSKASASSGSKTARSLDHGASMDAGQGPLRFLPMASMSGGANNTFKGDANTTRDASLSSKMTVTIIDIDESGNLVIEGSRKVTINGEDEITSLSGIVRPQDVSADNTVNSQNIANSNISYKGKGAVNEGSRVGLISRIINFMF
ncbi:MAG: flagellar basal body L-ring protein FlgH [Candidatus Cloacimonetes bacterium]|nr:flagellar basal body L-ring protein FlgH [Candidatus Cloacimonadota bacterium]